jgi:hypothetical protein
MVSVPEPVNMKLAHRLLPVENVNRSTRLAAPAQTE